MWIMMAMASLVAGTGCATKGFVQTEMDALRQQMVAGDDDLRAELAVVANSASEAMARAELALEHAGEARDLALGEVGYSEVESYTIKFGYDSFELGGDALMSLENAAGLIRGNPNYVVDIYGFTDSSGQASYNMLLGQKRAESVLRYLMERSSTSLQRFAAVSYGEDKPVSSNPADNRRVVVSVIARTPNSGDRLDQNSTDDSEGEITLNTK